MEKRQIEFIVTPLVVIIAIALVVSTLRKVTVGKRSRVSLPTENAPVRSTAGIALDTTNVPPSVSKPLTDALSEKQKTGGTNVDSLSWGRDPFVLDKASLFNPGVDQDSAAKLEQLSKLKLTGMIVSGESPKDSIAVINGENVKVGDTISGFSLKEIKQNSVFLSWGNEDFELKLWEEERGKRQGPIKQQ